jgi:hypothetical protein
VIGQPVRHREESGTSLKCFGGGGAMVRQCVPAAESSGGLRRPEEGSPAKRGRMG